MARVLISMKDDFLKQIDDLATDEQRTRSELIREALRLYMRKMPMSQTNGHGRILSDVLD